MLLIMQKKTNQPKETMNKIEQIIINELPNTTPVNDQKRIIDINKIDVAYRELEDNDNQYEIMKFILSCLSDQQIKDTKKLVKVWKQYERKLQKARNN
jgi:GTPase involved in cell partitioning and DNA repair